MSSRQLPAQLGLHVSNVSHVPFHLHLILPVRHVWIVVLLLILLPALVKLLSHTGVLASDTLNLLLVQGLQELGGGGGGGVEWVSGRQGGGHVW